MLAGTLRVVQAARPPAVPSSRRDPDARDVGPGNTQQPCSLGLRSAATLIGLLAAVLACAPRGEASFRDDASNLPAVDAASIEERATNATVARSNRGMVVSGSPLATAVGVRVLEEGGNAVDAAVALAFALGVVEPTQSGIGGRTQVLVRIRDGTVSAIDGTTEVPVAYTGGPTDDEAAYGYATIAVPGAVAALAQALRQHGTWSLARALAPAIALAADGYPLPPAEASRIASVRDRLDEFDGSAAAFLTQGGGAPAPGSRFRQPDLARTLRLIAQQGEDAFYRGVIAQRIAADMVANGGLVTAADLAAYRAEASIVVRGSYRDYDVIGSYLPASGATTIGILKIMDRFDLARVAGSADWVSIIAQALLAGFADREADVRPPHVKAAWLVSDSLADARAAGVRASDALRGRAPGPGAAANAPYESTPHRPGDSGKTDRTRHVSVADREPGPMTHVSVADREPEHTTHVSVADRDGNIVALTQSVGPTMGSKVVTPGLGFVYAATMGYLGELEPDTRRHWSSQSPLLVVKDGAPVWVLGGAGARRILSGLVETVSRALDQGLAPEAAVAAPRFHPVPTRLDVEVREGTAWPDSILDALRGFGFRVNPRDSAPWFARINAIHRDRDGEYTGVADRRWQGSAAAPRR